MLINSIGLIGLVIMYVLNIYILHTYELLQTYYNSTPHFLWKAPHAFMACYWWLFKYCVYTSWDHVHAITACSFCVSGWLSFINDIAFLLILICQIKFILCILLHGSYLFIGFFASITCIFCFCLLANLFLPQYGMGRTQSREVIFVLIFL